MLQDKPTKGSDGLPRVSFPRPPALLHQAPGCVEIPGGLHHTL